MTATFEPLLFELEPADAPPLEAAVLLGLLAAVLLLGLLPDAEDLLFEDPLRLLLLEAR